MATPRITIIAAVSHNGVIGNHLEIPWHIVADLKRFRAVTTRHTIIVGRTTFELIKKAYKQRNKPLPDRKTIIVTHNRDYSVADKQCFVVYSMEEAITLAKKIEPEEVFIAGGASIYKLGMPFADRLMLTIVHQDIQGDAYFPDFPKAPNLPNLPKFPKFPNVLSEESHEENGIHYTYRTLEP